MANIFISYAREDSAFVHRLSKALKARQIDTSIDTQDVLPAEEWRKKIASLIRGADAVISVISPDSVVSEECVNELRRAGLSNKRIVPILHRETAVDTAPQSLRDLNWINLRQADDWDRGVETILGALSTDPEWVNLHTRLTVRAHEWAEHDEDRSFTLRGRDLADAERWLAQATEKTPRPTDQQNRLHPKQPPGSQ